MSLRATANDNNVPVVTAVEVEAGQTGRGGAAPMAKFQRKKLYQSILLRQLCDKLLVFVCIFAISRLHYHEIGFRRTRTSRIVDK